MNNRRQFLAGAAASLALPLSNAAPRSLAPKPPAEHWVPGGVGGIVRARYAYTSTNDLEDYGTIKIPLPGVVFAVPLTVTEFDESGGSRFSLTDDGTITISQTGLYQLTMNLDWPGQEGVDVDLRKILLFRATVGTAPPRRTLNGVTPVPSNHPYHAILASDVPASDAPRYARSTVTWKPGTLPVGGYASIEVALAGPSYAVVPGDAVEVGMGALTDANLGFANAGLLLSARVVGKNIVRVMIENRYNTVPVTVPSGKLNVLAHSTVVSTGNSSDAWTTTTSAVRLLEAGEKLFPCVRVGTPGDYIQVDNMSYVQITAFA